MCGFAGALVGAATWDGEAMARAVREMSAVLTHRGPDDEGYWVSAADGVGLGFRRLSILDLSDLGHQPMASASGRFVVVFNGEIYNFQDLRKELEAKGHLFRGHSDTEVLLACFDEWGVPATLGRLLGMFAIAAWDGRERVLHLVRDRLGIKPLFVYSKNGTVLFASELKAILAWPGVDRSIDVDAVTAYFRYLYVPGPRSIFTHVKKVLPGHTLALNDPHFGIPPSTPFWSAEAVVMDRAREAFAVTEEEAVTETERLLLDAVRRRMVADVPVGAFLSGGIDSSTVVALMQAASSEPVRTFTIGFREPEYDESEHARAVAKHLGTDHTEVILDARGVLELVPRMPEIFDEPFADPSQMPTFLVSRVARRDVTVALSGDGGDEVFAGYNRYGHGVPLMERLLGLPRWPRGVTSAGIRMLTPGSWDRLQGVLSPVLSRRLRQRLLGEKMYKVGNLLSVDTPAEMYRSLLSAWQAPERLVIEGRDVPGALERVFGEMEALPLLRRMMLSDQLEYLPDDLLAKVDRASMAVSLEVRVPVLDHRVVEHAWSLPDGLKWRAGKSKWVLRQVLYRHVPREIVERPKMGFSVPISSWLRGDLKDWAGDLLSSDRIRNQGILEPEPVSRIWRDFQSGRSSDGLAVWALVMFQAWWDRWASAGSTRENRK